MPSQRSLQRDRAINLSLMNTVNVVFSRFICYLIRFSVIVISALNLLGLELWKCVSAGFERQWNYQRTWHFQANPKMFTVLPSDGVVVFDNLQIGHKQQKWLVKALCTLVYFSSALSSCLCHSILYLKVVKNHSINGGRDHFIFILGRREVIRKDLLIIR